MPLLTIASIFLFQLYSFCLCPHNVGQGQNATPDICFHLSVFQLRNKPKEPPKVPKSAPFFLPTVAGLQPQFAVPTDQDPEEVSSRRTHSPFTVDPREEIHCVNCFCLLYTSDAADES